MASVYSNLGPLDENSEQWSSYTERFEYFVQDNPIDQKKLYSYFNLKHSLYYITSYKQRNQEKLLKMYDQIVSTLKAHFSPKPLVIADRFQFYRRNQLEGDTVKMWQY